MPGDCPWREDIAKAEACLRTLSLDSVPEGKWWYVRLVVRVGAFLEEKLLQSACCDDAEAFIASLCRRPRIEAR